MSVDLITISPNDFYLQMDRLRVVNAMHQRNVRHLAVHHRFHPLNSLFQVIPTGNREFRFQPSDQEFFGDEGRNLRIRQTIFPPVRTQRIHYYVLTQHVESENHIMDTLGSIVSAVCGIAFFYGVMTAIKRNNQNL